MVHIALGWDAIHRLSPVWDEVIYPAAGHSLVTTRSIEFSSEHPLLSKWVMGVPLALLGASPAPALPNPYDRGFAFYYENKLPARTIVVASRLPMLILSCLTGLLLFLLARRHLGFEGGLITLAAYFTTPMFCARASLALLEMPMYFFIAASLFFLSEAFLTHDQKWFLPTGLMAGLALCCKLIALPFMTGVGVVICAWSYQQKTIKPALFFTMSLLTGFFTPYLFFHGGFASLRALFGWAAHTSAHGFYWRGEMKEAHAGIIAMAFLVKTPVALLVASVVGWLGWRQETKSRFFVAALVAGALGYLLVSFRGDSRVSTVQFSPIYFTLVLSSAGIGLMTNTLLKKTMLSVLALAMVGETAASHPNFLAYFNGLAGGPRAGYRWLADSDQDWGQALPLLADEWKKAGQPALIMAYSGAADPRDYGLTYQDLFSPALVSRVYQGELFSEPRPRVWLVVGTKLFQSYAAAFGWIHQNRRPIRVVGSCFWVYDLSHDPPAYQWLAQFYAETGRPRQAQWAVQQGRKPDFGTIPPR